MLLKRDFKGQLKIRVPFRGEHVYLPGVPHPLIRSGGQEVFPVSDAA